MKYIKKWMTLLLAAAMLTGMTACGGTEADTTETTPAETTDTSLQTDAAETDPAERDDLPTDNKEHEGYTFTIISFDFPDAAIAWRVADIYTEELNGERINDAVFERNLAMTDRFGVSVAQNLINRDTVVSEVKQLITAGDDAFDLFQCNAMNQSSLAVEGYLLDMAKIDYIDFDKAWWDRSAMEGISVGGKIYHAFGDNSLNSKKSTLAVLFNKALTEKAGVPDLYTIVKEGDWTLDLLTEYAEQIAMDVNGDGARTYGDDIFGVGVEHGVAVWAFSSSGLTTFSIADDGSAVYNLNSSAALDAMEIVNRFMTASPDFVLNAQNAPGEYNGNFVEFRKLFMSDKIGFYMGHLGTVTLVGGEMNSDFGILPFPKVFADQDEYYSTLQLNNAMTVSIPKSASDTTRTGLLTEAYVMFSHDTVLPAYYDYTLTMRSARDEESEEMLDIIFANRIFDIGIAFSGNLGSGPYKFLTDTGIAETFNYASKEASTQKSLITSFEKSLAAILEIEY